jgi:general stress protein CsbA
MKDHPVFDTGVDSGAIDNPTPEQTPNSILESPPYAAFAIRFLSASIVGSFLVVNLADAIARGHWVAKVYTIILLVIAILFAKSTSAVWHQIITTEPETDPALKRIHRRVLRRCAVMFILLFTAAAAVGSAIGTSGSQEIKLTADLAQVQVVGSRISKARDSVEPTVASHIQMYRTIEPDVLGLNAALQKLRDDYRIYDSKFPEQHKTILANQADVETGLQRMAILELQIGVAKQIDALDPNLQLAAWNQQMQPLLDREDALDSTK